MKAAFRKNRTRGRARLLEGWTKEHGWTRGAEIGVFRGDTFLHLLRTCPELELVGVDIWKPLHENAIYPGGRSYASWDLDKFYRDLVKSVAPFGDRARLIKALTVEAAQEFPDNHFDFVFIDADHSREGVTADILAWSPKVNPSGWIAGHDYNTEKFKSVVRVVDELLPNARIFADHVWAVPKAETVFA